MDAHPSTKHWTPNPDPTSIKVPGVDATASVNDQIDQIDQLITIRLQNIDANFSRIQHIISNRLLPAFKRYAEGTEPVREAAKFWKSFYETAAQVRIPIANDTSSLYHTEDGDSERDATLRSADDIDDTLSNVTSHGDLFARDGPISSTPLVRDPINISLPPDPEGDESWTASIESPFERLGRQLKDLTSEEAQREAEDPSTSDAPSFSPMHGRYTNITPQQFPLPAASPPVLSEQTPQIPHSRRREKSPLRQNVLRQNAAVSAVSSAISTPRQLHASHRVKTPKNPFLPAGSVPRRWNGLVDLRQPSPARSKAHRTPLVQDRSAMHDGDDPDSSDDLFPPGMSPPVTMQFAMAPRMQRSPVKLALTPARRAAERIGRDLVANAVARGVDAGSVKAHFDSVQKGGFDPSVSSVAPSLPSLSRYSKHSVPSRPSAPAFALEPPKVLDRGGVATPEHRIYRPSLGQEVFTRASELPNVQQRHPDNNPRLIVDEGLVPGSDSDSESEHDESNPSAAFLLTTQNNVPSRADDSFASSQSDEEEDGAEGAARHPLAHMFAGRSEDDEAEDSFDQDNNAFGGAQEEEETVFGARQAGQISGEKKLQIMRALIDQTDPDASSLNPFAQVHQTPTPQSGNADDFV